jgi:hypothetical protein
MHRSKQHRLFDHLIGARARNSKPILGAVQQ